MMKVTQKIENSMQLVIELRFHSSAVKDVDIEKLWLALLSEFRLETAVSVPDIFAFPTFHLNIVDFVHKNNALISNAGHFGCKIDLAGSDAWKA